MKTRALPTAVVAFAVGLSLGLVAAQSDPSPAGPPAPAEETLSIEPTQGLVGSSHTSLMKPIAYRVGDSTHKIGSKSGESARVAIIPLRVNDTRVLLVYEIMPNQ